MFSATEKKLLKLWVEKHIQQIHTQLASELSNDERDLIERELIVGISVLNKLESHSDKSIKTLPTRALIVDDVQSMRDLNKQILIGIGFRNVEVASDGQQALNMLVNAANENNAFGLVISDWEMPNMTGLELLRKIRTNAILMRTPVFLLTGLSNKKNIIDAVHLGVNGYLLKPITPKVFQSHFKDFLTTPVDLLPKPVQSFNINNAIN